MSGTNTGDSPKGNLRPPWTKGQSGNPTGRPKGDAWFRKLCRKRTLKALKALERAMDSDEHSPAVSAAKALLEFGWGKAPPRVELPDDVTAAASGALTDEQVRALARAKLEQEH